MDFTRRITATLTLKKVATRRASTEKSEKYGIAWESTSPATKCRICGVKFDLMHAKHHCRQCGIVVCGNCSKSKAPVTAISTGIVKPRRVCDRCKAGERVGGTGIKAAELRGGGDDDDDEEDSTAARQAAGGFATKAYGSSLTVTPIAKKAEVAQKCSVKDCLATHHYADGLCATHRSTAPAVVTSQARRASQSTVASVPPPASDDVEEPGLVPPPPSDPHPAPVTTPISPPKPKPGLAPSSAPPGPIMPAFCCADCGEPIRGGFIKVFDKPFHPDHLRCCVCKRTSKELGGAVRMNEGKVYCEADYATAVAGSCIACSKPFTSLQVVRTEDGNMHMACYACTHCSVELAGVACLKKNGKLYCEKHYHMLFSPKCAACNLHIVGPFVSALDLPWHKDCFKCADCDEPLGSEFYRQEGSVYCVADYNERFASKCAGCGFGILGTCITALDKPWHPECFACTSCGDTISRPSEEGDKGATTFYTEGGMPYCASCNRNQNETRCYKCRLPIETSFEIVDGHLVHTECKIDLTARHRGSTASSVLDIDDSASAAASRSGSFVDRPGLGSGRLAIVDLTDVITPPPLESELEVPDSVDALPPPVSDSRASVRSPPVPTIAPPRASVRAPAMPKMAAPKASRPALPIADVETSPRGTGDAAARVESAVLLPKDRIASSPIVAAASVNKSKPKKKKKAKKPGVEPPPDFGRIISVCIAEAYAAERKESKGASGRLKAKDFKTTRQVEVFIKEGITVQVEDYAPRVFNSIRQRFDINEESYLRSVGDKNQPLSGGSTGAGKSGMLFLFAHDKRYIVKTVKRGEVDFFRKILAAYEAHMAAHEDSLLSRFYGLYKIKYPGLEAYRVVVMNNVFLTKLKIGEVYDLKGSTVKRFVTDEEKEAGVKVLKDVNFDRERGEILVGASNKEAMIIQMTMDVAFLRDNNVMDYSLLVGIHDPGMTGAPINPSGTENGFMNRFQQEDGGLRSRDRGNRPLPITYFLGIIDILQEYNLEKKLENLYKGTIKAGILGKYDGTAISAVASKDYADRFISYMSHAMK